MATLSRNLLRKMKITLYVLCVFVFVYTNLVEAAEDDDESPEDDDGSENFDDNDLDDDTDPSDEESAEDGGGDTPPKKKGAGRGKGAGKGRSRGRGGKRSRGRGRGRARGRGGRRNRRRSSSGESSNDSSDDSDDDSRLGASQRPARGSSRRRHHRPQVPNCRDIHLNCPLTSKLCMVDWAFDQMVEYCPKTCNRCPNREIIDISDSCRDERRKCNDPDNIDLMAWLCPRTCRYDRNSRPQRPSGRIGAAPAGCVDANSNCASWKANGFCENPFYYVEHKRLNCALSCGLCGATV